jgi:hypothetical protein
MAGKCEMEKWIEELTDGPKKLTDGQTNGYMDGQADRRMDRLTYGRMNG